VIDALKALDKTMRTMSAKKYLVDTGSKSSTEIESDDTGVGSGTVSTHEFTGSSSSAINDALSLEQRSEEEYSNSSKSNVSNGVGIRMSVSTSAQVI